MFCVFQEDHYLGMWRSLDVARSAARTATKQLNARAEIYRSLKGADPRDCHDPLMQHVETVQPEEGSREREGKQ